MISIKNLSKSFGTTKVLDNVSFDISDGSTTVIIGGSGCGKSTLLRCINRLETPDSGVIEIGGENILEKGVDIDKVRRKIGMVYQSFNLFSHLNVMENMILSPMKVLGMKKSEAIEMAEEYLKQVGMENRCYHMPDQLSGGQKQRVAIARALAMQPKVMLFDEPTSALDPTMVDEVEAVIRRLVENGMTSVIVTHEMRFAKNIASDVVFLAEQGIYERGTPEQIFENPSRNLTRQFLYRTRMFESVLAKDDIDVYALCSEIRHYGVQFGMTARQASGIEHLMDELLLPILRASENPNNSATVRLIADESRNEFSITMEFPTLQKDPLGSGIIDEFGIKILSAFVKKWKSAENDRGIWTVLAEI